MNHDQINYIHGLSNMVKLTILVQLLMIKLIKTNHNKI
jgi:hypothetical protein